MLQPIKHWSMHTALGQLEKCDYECEGGPLSLNDAWLWLNSAAKVGPKFWPGQGVWFEVTAEAAGKKLSQWTHFFIVGCHMDANTDDRFWTYDLSYDPPRPWHYGTTHFNRINGGRLRLENPAPQ